MMIFFEEFNPRALLIRDLCACSDCRHPGNGQRHKLAQQLDLSISLVNVEARDEYLKFEFSDGHISIFQKDGLAEALNTSVPMANRGEASKVLWSASAVHRHNRSKPTGALVQLNVA
jgi:DUF971 family protein